MNPPPGGGRLSALGMLGMHDMVKSQIKAAKQPLQRKTESRRNSVSLSKTEDEDTQTHNIQSIEPIEDPTAQK